jgi:hypothetical protein
MLAVHIPNLLPKSVLSYNLTWIRPAGRLIWSTVILLIGIGVIVFLARRPKPAEPPTWAQAMVGAIVVFALMILAYGTVPHEWIIFGNSYHDWSAANYLMHKNRILHFDINLQAVNDTVAALIYVVMLVTNVALFSLWQKRPVREPEPADSTDAGTEARQPVGTSAYNRPVTAKG